VQLLSWNVNQLALWSELRVERVALALLQEAPAPPASLEGDDPLEIVPVAEPRWETPGPEKRPWRTAIAGLSGAVALKSIPLSDMGGDPATLRVSRPGTIAAATVLRDGVPLFNVASVYALWERPLDSESPIWADASAHRLLSDLTPLIWRRGLPLIVSGDWNILRGYGEYGDAYYGARYQTVFDRAGALGLAFIGPKQPDGGRQADPWPEELPPDSTCVPTYYRSGQTPETATRQLDFVFASASIAGHVRATALNGPDEWGPSDHCRVLIDVDL